MYFEDLIESKDTISKQAIFEEMIAPTTRLLTKLQAHIKRIKPPFTDQDNLLCVITELTRLLLKKILLLPSEPVPIQDLLKEIIKIKNSIIAYDKQVISSQRLTILKNALNTLMQNLLASEPRPLFPIKPIINPSPETASYRKQLSPRVPFQQINQPNKKLEKIEEEETFRRKAKRKWNATGKQISRSSSSCFRSSCAAILSCLKCFAPSSQPAEATPLHKRYSTSPAQTKPQSFYAEEKQYALIEDLEPISPSAQRMKK